MRNVMVTGGWAHDFATHAPLLAAAIDVAVPDLETEIVDDLDALADAVVAGTDLVTIYACRFRMLDDRYSPEQRAEWAMEIPAAARHAVTAHVSSGRPLFAVHTAAVCFDDWPEWGDLLGGAWSWERSWHPPPEEMIVRFVADHPIVDGLGVADADERPQRTTPATAAMEAEPDRCISSTSATPTWWWAITRPCSPPATRCSTTAAGDAPGGVVSRGSGRSSRL